MMISDYGVAASTATVIDTTIARLNQIALAIGIKAKLMGMGGAPVMALLEAAKRQIGEARNLKGAVASKQISPADWFGEAEKAGEPLKAAAASVGEGDMARAVDTLLGNTSEQLGLGRPGMGSGLVLVAAAAAGAWWWFKGRRHA